MTAHRLRVGVAGGRSALLGSKAPTASVWGTGHSCGATKTAPIGLTDPALLSASARPENGLEPEFGENAVCRTAPLVTLTCMSDGQLPSADDGARLRGPEDVKRLIERGREAGALAALRAARQSAEPSELQLVAAGFGHLEQWAEAAETLRTAIELRPGDGDLWTQLGDALVMGDHLDEAMTAYLQAIDHGAVGEVLEALLELKLEDRAIELLTAARERHPASGSICDGLAFAYGLSGEHERAADLFGAALEIDPENLRTRWNLTRALTETGHSLEAWRVFWQQPAERTTGPTRVDLYDQPSDLPWQVGHPKLLRALQYAIEWHVPQIRSGGPDRDSDLAFSFDIEAATLRSTLAMEPAGPGVRFVVTSTDGTPVQDPDLRVWRTVVDEALDHFREPGDSTWFAVIGTTPGGMFEYADQRLRAAGKVGSIDLRPCAAMEECIGIVGLDDDKVRQIHPVLLEGACRNDHDGGIYAYEEGIQTRRVCALLSLAWGRCWTIKLHPHPERPPGVVLDAQLPTLDRSNNLMSTEVVELPSWLAAAWKNVEDDPNLSDALDSFYEGMLLLSEHPSLAMVAFVICCETHGSRSIPERRSRARVRAALETVLNPEDAGELVNAYYTHRNETAHQGKLHGLEKSSGRQLDRMVGEENPELAFSLGLLRGLRDATRDLLLSAVGGSRPAR